MNKTLTKKQLDVYDFISDYILDNRVSPTFQEISDELGYHRSLVHRRVNEIKDKGWIDYQPRGTRTITIENDYNKWVTRHSE